jgi:hypothetical protein
VQEFEIWVKILGDWLRDWFPHDGLITIINGAVPATGSGYFSFCFPLHIPDDSDLVVIELGVNDEPDPEMVDNMEALLRGVLGMDNSPAVMLAEAMAFSMGQMSGGGGRYHLPVAQYYGRSMGTGCADALQMSRLSTSATHLPTTLLGSPRSSPCTSPKSTSMFKNRAHTPGGASPTCGTSTGTATATSRIWWAV